jgi:hypothetical protein
MSNEKVVKAISSWEQSKCISCDAFLRLNASFRNLSQGVAEDASFFLMQDRSVLFEYDCNHEVDKATARSQATNPVGQLQ